MLRGHHVLIIEDEPLIDLEHALSSAGGAVNVANTVASALEAAAGVPFLAKPLPAGQVVDMLARVVSAKAKLRSSKNEMRDPV
jgi:hypothetical protein